MKTALIALSALAASFGAAHADDAPPTVAIELDPAALSTPDGREALRARIQDAVETVCEADDARDADQRRLQQACEQAAAAEAAGQLRKTVARLGVRQMAGLELITVRSR